MKIVLVSYFYPPVITVASQRWMGFVQELEKNGNEVTVVTGPWLSKTSEKNVFYYKDPISDDGRIFKNTPKKHKFSVRKFLQKFIPTFLFIDGKILWSLQLCRILLSPKFKSVKKDLVIVTGTPWSSVVVTSICCRLTGTPYAIDFRDMWADDPILHFGTAIARKYFAWLERFCARGACMMMTVNEPLRAHLEKLNPRIHTCAIANGYAGQIAWTHTSFNDTRAVKKQILYAGSIGKYHGIELFLDSAKTDIPLVFMGRDFIGALKNRSVLRLEERNPQLAEEEMSKSAVLLISLDSSSTHYITGKLMSYIKAGRPILLFGPKTSPAAELILKHRIGWVIDPSQPEKLAPLLKEISEHLNAGKPFNFEPDAEGLKHYSIESLGARLNACLNAISSSKT